MSKRIQERITIRSQRITSEGSKRRYGLDVGIDEETLCLSDALSEVGAIEPLERVLKHSIREAIASHIKGARALVVSAKTPKSESPDGTKL